jgi:hypothetical protein
MTTNGTFEPVLVPRPCSASGPVPFVAAVTTAQFQFVEHCFGEVAVPENDHVVVEPL